MYEKRYWFTMCSVGYWRFHSNPSLSAEHNENRVKLAWTRFFYCVLHCPAAGGEGCAKSHSDCANPWEWGIMVLLQLWPFILQGPRGERQGMCDRSEQIPPSSDEIPAQRKIPVDLHFLQHWHKAGGASPLGVACAACFEQLACVFASCGVLHYAKI